MNNFLILILNNLSNELTKEILNAYSGKLS